MNLSVVVVALVGWIVVSLALKDHMVLIRTVLNHVVRNHIVPGRLVDFALVVVCLLLSADAVVLS